VITMLTDAAAILAVMGQARSRAGRRPSGSRPAWSHGRERVAGPLAGGARTRSWTSRDRHQGDGQAVRLVLLASGPDDALDRAQPIFRRMRFEYPFRSSPEAGGRSA